MGEFLPLAVAVALVWSVVKVVKYATNRMWNEAMTLLVVHGAGILVAFLLHASDFADSIAVGAFKLGDLNGASVVLFGVALGSAAAAAYDVRKSVDSSDSAAEPKMFPKAPAEQ